MLRASAEHTGRPVDLRAVGDPGTDALVGGGLELVAFVDALVGRSRSLDQARTEAAAALGPDGASAIARTVGNFEMMNRLLDATGVAVPVSMGEIAPDLGLPPFHGR